MKNKQYVIIHHPCMFTRVAMNTIIRKLGEEYAIKETACLMTFMQENNLPPVCSQNLLITHVPSCFSLINTMHMMGRFQPTHALKTIILTNIVLRPLVMDFLNQYSDRCFILDEYATFETVSENVKNFIGSEAVNITDWHLPKSLSAREFYVIKCLINGMSIRKIANDLGLSYKTVGHYKISALRKLGFRHLNSIFSVKCN